MTKEGLRKPTYWGSVTQASTCRVGNYLGDEVFTPFKSLLPMVNPDDIVLGGWDISNFNLADAMGRAKVSALQPLPSNCPAYGGGWWNADFQPCCCRC